MKQVRAKLPEWDFQNSRPKSKMPNCPNCGEDELSMTAPSYTFCNVCNVWVEKSGDLIDER